jgi:PAS domain S-box-containing protein
MSVGVPEIGIPQLGTVAERESTPIIEAGRHLLELLGASSGPTVSDTTGEAAPYREFLEALGVAVYTTDADGRITFFNEAAATFWGRRPELGEEWCGSLRLFHTDGRPMRHAACPMAIALKQNRTVRGEEAIAERPDGSRVFFVPYPTPLRDASGTLIGAVNVLVDVTERRRAEDKLRAAAEELEASNKVKDEFLGLVSHELRTPVTTILGNAEFLRQRAGELPDATKAGMIDDIADDSQRLLGIIENLLLLTRLGAGARPDLEPQILGHVVRKAVDSFARRHPHRDVSFSGEAPRDLIVEADSTWLELLIENLLGNADKYSPLDGPIEVVVRVRDGRAHVCVLDRGIGIPAADADQVFIPFYRSDGAKARASGLGIGLALCKRLAETQGGRIWAAARDGGGTEVGFELPIAAEVAA